MKYELIIDRNISVWSRAKVIVESDSLENAINSALEEDEKYKNNKLRIYSRNRRIYRSNRSF